MSNTIFRSCSFGVVALAMLLVSTPTLAADNAPNNTGTVNCGDQGTKDACFECCTTITCIGKITCCPLVGDCSVVNKATGASLPLKLKLVAGGLKLKFERKIKPTGVDLKLKASFLKKVFPKGLNMKAHLTGDDAQIAALLFPVAFLGSGESAASTLQGNGYDFTVDGALPTCQSLFPEQLCSDLAFGLARSIYGSLGVGIRSELDAFVTGANGVGYGPCQTFE